MQLSVRHFYCPHFRLLCFIPLHFPYERRKMVLIHCLVVSVSLTMWEWLKFPWHSPHGPLTKFVFCFFVGWRRWRHVSALSTVNMRQQPSSCWKLNQNLLPLKLEWMIYRNGQEPCPLRVPGPEVCWYLNVMNDKDNNKCHSLML